MTVIMRVTKTLPLRRRSSTHSQLTTLRRHWSTLACWNLSNPTILMIDKSSSKSLKFFRRKVWKRTMVRLKVKIWTLSNCRRISPVSFYLASSNLLMKHNSEWRLNQSRLRNRSRHKSMRSCHLHPSIKNQYLCHCTHTSEKNCLNNNLTISTIAGNRWR